MPTATFIANEYRLVIPGKAVSFRSPDRRQYQRRVGRIAEELFKSPKKGSFEIRIDYFFADRRKMDMDNIAKCIMDALNGIAYFDDRQIRLEASVGHDLSKLLRIHGGPVDMVKPLRNHEEYVFVRLREAAMD